MDKKIKTIDCVVVTYNRLELLKENLTRLQLQTYPIRTICVINNNSNDGTREYLEQFNHNKKFNIRHLKENIGGAGGFAKGIELCAINRADWIWIMDDDTIPEVDALEKLMPYTGIDHIGYVNSQVLWTDGQPHLMNIPRPLKDQSRKMKVFHGHEAIANDAQLIHNASFVSLLINGDMPWKLGLPFSEFFIWCDDAEYTLRITDAGYHGIHTISSTVIHKTKTNYESSLKTLTADMAWKLYYGERNESYLRRKRKGLLMFLLSQLNEIRLHRHQIKKRHMPKEDEKKLLNASWRGLIDGIFFNPKVQFPHPNS